MCCDMVGVVVSSVLTLCVLEVLPEVVELVLGVSPGDAVTHAVAVAPTEFVAALEGLASPVAVGSSDAL
jgi:hypothetical protein